jgi:Membrane protease subunits, stomatin/prohibitin homologs
VNDLFQTVIEIVKYLWPFYIVMEWQRANYYVCGHMWRKMGPGLKFVVPFFTEVRAEGVVPTVYMSPLQSITLKDGSTLTFSAVITLELVDTDKAINKVLEWHQTVIETASGLLAEKLADTDVGQFEAVKRGYLVGGCRTALNNALSDLGVKVTNLRFNNFIRNMRVYRILNDQVVSNAE